MDKLLSLFKNIKGGPMTTLVGLVLFFSCGTIIFETKGDENQLAWVSVEVGLFVLGIYFLVISDSWIKTLFIKKDINDEE